MPDRPRVLVVEDEMLLASDVEYLLEQAGMRPAGLALRAGEAISLATDLQPDMALVDVHLLDGPTGVEVGKYMAEQLGIPVIFTTGNVSRVPADFAGAYGLIEKPYTEHGFLAAMRFMNAYLRQRPTPRAPATLMLAPWFARRLQDREIDAQRTEMLGD